MTDNELEALFSDWKPLGAAAPVAGPRYPVGDCRIGDCERPADHRGRHGKATPREARNAR